MRNPENILRVTVAALLLSGVGCILIGVFFDHDLVAKIGRWILISAIMLAFAPLVFSGIMMIAENVRRK